jgi:hypothetical protein
MKQTDRRKIENQLLAMGLPDLTDPSLIQVVADMVNAYPMPSERVQFFCDLLNECDLGHRYEMYNALVPKLHFPVPSFPECETRIAAKAERMVGKDFRQSGKKDDYNFGRTLLLKCRGCEAEKTFGGLTLADAMMSAKKEGWGRGPIPGFEYCAECRMNAMQPASVGSFYTRRHHALES